MLHVNDGNVILRHLDMCMGFAYQCLFSVSVVRRCEATWIIARLFMAACRLSEADKLADSITFSCKPLDLFEGPGYLFEEAVNTLLFPTSPKNLLKSLKEDHWYTPSTLPFHPLYIFTMASTVRHTEPVPAAGGVKEDCFPLFIANDGYTKQEGDGETTETCFCGAVQYAFVSLHATAYPCLRLHKRSIPADLASMYLPL
jgi:hypothetical protein